MTARTYQTELHLIASPQHQARKTFEVIRYFYRL